MSTTASCSWLASHDVCVACVRSSGLRSSLSRCLESASNGHRIVMNRTILLCPPLFAVALQTLEEEPSASVAAGAPSSNTAPQSRAEHGRGCFCVYAEAGSLSNQHRHRSVVTCCLLFYPACLCLSGSWLEWKDCDKGQTCVLCVCVCIKNPVPLTWKEISQIRLDIREHTLLSASQRPPCPEACRPSQDRDASFASAAVIIIIIMV